MVHRVSLIKLTVAKECFSTKSEEHRTKIKRKEGGQDSDMEGEKRERKRDGG